MYLFFILFSGRPISPIATFYVKITQPFKNSNKPIKLPTALTQLILGGLFEVSNLDFLVYWPFSRLQTSET